MGEESSFAIERRLLLAAQQERQDNFDRLLQAAKQWKNATESRLRMLDSRGEAAKSMLKPDADLIAVINELSSPDTLEET